MDTGTIRSFVNLKVAYYLMGEVWNEEQLEVRLPTGRKAIMNNYITLNLVIDSVIFRQQCFFLLITNPIILGSDFLDTHLTVLDISDHASTLHCADYMLTTSLTCDPVYD